MSTVPQPLSSQPNPQDPSLSSSHKNIVMGRVDFLSTLLRSIWGELFKIERRLMTKILAIIALVIIILSAAVISIPVIIDRSQPASNYLPPPCSALPQGTTDVPCLKQSPTQQDLAQAEQTKQHAINNAAAALQFPNLLNALGTVIRYIGVIVLIILAGTIVGGDYSTGTIRMLLTRGPTRLQFLLAKIGAILVCVFVTTLVLIAIGAITAEIFSLAIGVSGSAPAVTGTQLSHMTIYTLLTMLHLFSYSLLAIALAILGKSPAAGVAGALIWWFLEGVIGNVLTLIGTLNPGSFGNVLKAIPDYFLGNNLSALLDNQVQYWNGQGISGSLSDLHAILVVLAYIIVFVAVPWWINHTRDITN
jgi:ABC-type transport system involved in multi-copper enzyme maturation permease subunit